MLAARVEQKNGALPTQSPKRSPIFAATYARRYIRYLSWPPFTASPPGTSEHCPLLLIPCLVGIFDRLNRLDVFCDILRRQAVLPATGKDKVLVPAVGFEAVVDVTGGGEKIGRAHV